MDEKVTAARRPEPGQRLSAEQAMQFAIAEAKRGLAHVAPNPTVGCVILDARDGFLASGFHEKFGEAHAEANALKGLSEPQLKGAKVFVTLEPCAHEGKTPSCAKALAKFPLAVVVYGVQDPNPLVAGKGAEIIRAAGIPCETYAKNHGENLQAALEESCEAFLWNHRHKSVFVSLKVAASLDGRIALADGTSQWITSPASRERGHELRAGHDAILIGAGTLDRDNPNLDIRHPRYSKRNIAVVLDTEGQRLGRTWKLAQSHESKEILWLVAGDRASQFAANTSARVMGVDRKTAGGLDPHSILRVLWVAGVRSVLIEGGARVAGDFLRAGLVNRLHVFTAPLLLGSKGRSWTEGLEIPTMSERPLLENCRMTNEGPDFHLTGLLRNPQTGDHRRGM